MDELVKNALEEYFSDFKEYHLIILISFTVIIALLQIIQSYIVSKKIEKVKNDLKKSEIKFSKYNQLQVEALSEIYPVLADLLVNTVIIKSEFDKASPERISSLAENWGKSFNETFHYFTQKQYILTKSINSKYAILIGNLIKMNAYVRAEKQLSLLYLTLNNGEVEFMGDDEERNKLSGEISEIKKDEVMAETLDSISGLKSEIQNYFEKME